MPRRNRLSRHFLTLKRRVDDIQKELTREEVPSFLLDLSESVAISDDLTLTVSGGGSRTTEIIDSFEDGGLSEYQGDTGNAQVQQLTTYHGTDALQMDSGGNAIYSPEGAGLDQYFPGGETADVRHQFLSGAVPRFYFGVDQSTPDDDHYYVELDSGVGSMRLVKTTGGIESTKDSTSVTFDTNAWIRTEITRATNGQIDVSHFDSGGTKVGALSITDSSPLTGEGVGFGEFSSGEISLHDYARLTSVTPDELTVASVGASSITDTSADLTGDLQSLGNSASADVNFEYRPVGGSFSSTSTQTVSSTGQYTQTVSGLSGGTDYEWRAKASAGGDTDTGAIKTFTAVDLDVDTVGASNIDNSSADLTGDLVTLAGVSAADVNFEYRPVGGSFNSTSTISKSSTGQYTQSVSGLSSATDYEFRAKGVVSNTTDTGSLLTFTTDGAAITVAEDFEDGDIAEWSGATTMLAVNSSTPINGSYDGEISDSVNGGTIQNGVVSIDNLDFSFPDKPSRVAGKFKYDTFGAYSGTNAGDHDGLGFGDMTDLKISVDGTGTAYAGHAGSNQIGTLSTGVIYFLQLSNIDYNSGDFDATVYKNSDSSVIGTASGTFPTPIQEPGTIDVYGSGDPTFYIDDIGAED